MDGRGGGCAQLASGFWAASTTRISTGPLAGTSLRPSCSWTAAKTEGASLEVSAGVSSGRKWSLMS